MEIMMLLLPPLLLLCCFPDQSVCIHPKSKRSNPLAFMVLGDWGGLPVSPYRTNIEVQVAKGLGQVAESLNSQFQIALGDNFYFDGVQSVDDKRFKETFEDVFTAQSLQNDWYFIAGNHDWNGNASAQLKYSEKSKRWNYPAFYYRLSFTGNDGTTLEIVMIDTVILCGNVDSDFSRSAPEGPREKVAADDQWKWIEATLKTSRADYLLVAGHYPVYSVAEHGPTKCLLDQLKPMLYKYNVSAYINGHDHNLQHLQEDTQTGSMDYFVIGSANFADPSLKHSGNVPENSLKFHDAGPDGGFAHVQLNKDGGLLTFVTGTNKELYQAKLKHRNQ